MIRRMALALVLFLAASAALAAEARLVSIPTPRGVTQAFILIVPPRPKASVILFAGGDGYLGLTGAASMHSKRYNFLVRTRERFAADDFMVAVVDVPSDRRKLDVLFRISAAHARDIGAVVSYLKKQADIPVWLIGTSMGTFSAAEGAIANHADGLVLTSTITRTRKKWYSHPDAVASMPLSRVRVPTLIVAHRHDGCDVSPPTGAPKLKRALSHAKPVQIVFIDGGLLPRSAPCEARAQHGYYGVEDKAVGVIADFIKANSR